MMVLCLKRFGNVAEAVEHLHHQTETSQVVSQAAVTYKTEKEHQSQHHDRK